MIEVQFLEDAKTQDAVIRNFNIIGEACRNIDNQHPEFTQEHPEVPWGFAYEMRNALAHGYFKIDIIMTTTKTRVKNNTLPTKGIHLTLLRPDRFIEMPNVKQKP